MSLTRVSRSSREAYPSHPLGPLLECDQRIFHDLSTRYPPYEAVIHSVIHIFRVKLVDKGVVTLSSVRYTCSIGDFSLSVEAYFIIESSFVRTTAIGEVTWFVSIAHFLPFLMEKPLPA